MRLTEIGEKIKEQRLALGLTQEQLSRLAQLSRTTINQLENGTLSDLGYSKLAHLLGILGLNLEAQPVKGLQHGLSVAARSASTSYREALSPDGLATILRSGQLPSKYYPHLMVLLDETPLPVVLKAVREAVELAPGATSRQVMQNISKWAKELHAHRAVW